MEKHARLCLLTAVFLLLMPAGCMGSAAASEGQESNSENPERKGVGECGEYPDLAADCLLELDEWNMAVKKWQGMKARFGNYTALGLTDHVWKWQARPDL